jgi:hypothetical protein
MNTGNVERSDSDVRSNNWRIRIAGALGSAAGAAVALLWRPDLGGFWSGLIAFVIMTVLGGVLGQLAGRLLFRPSSGGPPQPKSAHPE